MAAKPDGSRTCWVGLTCILCWQKFQHNVCQTTNAAQTALRNSPIRQFLELCTVTLDSNHGSRAAELEHMNSTCELASEQ